MPSVSSGPGEGPATQSTPLQDLGGHVMDVDGIMYPPQLSYGRAARHNYDSDSDDDSDDTFDEKHRLADMHATDFELGSTGATLSREGRNSAKKRRRRGWFCFLVLVLAAATVIAFGLSHAFSGHSSFTGEGLKTITIEHLANGTFQPHRESIDWLAEAGDGVYSYRTSDGSIVLEDVANNKTSLLVDGEKIVNPETGKRLPWARFKVSADLKYILFDTDYSKQWRYSSHANFWVHNVETGDTIRLREESKPPHTAIASFSPTSHHIAYVHANDIYVLDGPPDTQGFEAIRVTIDGSPTTFNGVPDWAYEEEVFTAESAMWWSPDGQKIAFLSFDEEQVPEYDFPVYNPSPVSPGGEPYPTSVVMRYPKPGYPNPKVKLSVFDLGKYLTTSERPTLADASESGRDPRVVASTYLLEFDDPFDEDDKIISEVAWVGENDLMVKATNRIANKMRVAHFDLGKDASDGSVVGKVVRADDFEARDGGWVETDQTMIGIDATRLLHSDSLIKGARDKYPPGYLDIVPNKDGYNHVALFSPPENGEPVFLTSGDWEIVDGLQAVDLKRGLIYFIAAKPSISRHLFSVPLPTRTDLGALKDGTMKPDEPILLTNATVGGYNRVSFSPFGGFYVLNNEGPGVPWQKLVKVDDKDYEHVLANNTELARTEAQFQRAEMIYGTLEVNGAELNTVEMRPPMMDVSGRTKYPVLFQVYGGPGSQMVSEQWTRDWHHFLVTSLGYVVVKVDPRGTGFKGRQFRMSVRGRLGKLEAEDVVETARHWSSLPYIDQRRVGVWGWSYGGFLTAKIVETNSSVFTLGMSVAPVADWRFYDSIYTERYMSTPKLNPIGYRNSSVREMDGFKHVAFALAHGSGDDNVHYLNTAALLDRFTVAQVRGFRFRMFTDSDHGISRRGAYWELMHWLTDFLLDNWGEGGRTKQRWKLREFEWDFERALDDGKEREKKRE